MAGLAQRRMSKWVAISLGMQASSGLAFALRLQRGEVAPGGRELRAAAG